MDELTSYLPCEPADPNAPTESRLLRLAEARTLAEPRPRPGLLARALFLTMDVVYGKAPSLPKFVVLELVARVPYQAWENVGYVAISHLQTAPPFARRVFEYVRAARTAQDNEQWHLFILQELVQRRGHRGSWLLFRAFPQLLAFAYYHVSWLLYTVKPRLSYALNADFETHAERSYMRYVHDHPELDAEPWQSGFAADYGSYASIGDLLRRIGLDERAHRMSSLAEADKQRFDLDAPSRRLSGATHPG